VSQEVFMWRNGLVASLAGPLLAFGLTTPALAQPAPRSAGDVAIGYGILHDSEFAETAPLGLIAAIRIDFHGPLSAVGEVGASHKAFSDGYGYTISSYEGGVRATGRRLAAGTPFAQILLGGTHCTCDGTASAVQVGGGLDVPVSRFFARAQGDLRVLRQHGASWREWRAAFSIVVPLGGK
jgi:hypothetical protein